MAIVQGVEKSLSNFVAYIEVALIAVSDGIRLHHKKSCRMVWFDTCINYVCMKPYYIVFYSYSDQFNTLFSNYVYIYCDHL